MPMSPLASDNAVAPDLAFDHGDGCQVRDPGFVSTASSALECGGQAADGGGVGDARPGGVQRDPVP